MFSARHSNQAGQPLRVAPTKRKRDRQQRQEAILQQLPKGHLCAEPLALPATGLLIKVELELLWRQSLLEALSEQELLQALIRGLTVIVAILEATEPLVFLCDFLGPLI